jgi:hypothetical protein
MRKLGHNATNTRHSIALYLKSYTPSSTKFFLHIVFPVCDPLTCGTLVPPPTSGCNIIYVKFRSLSIQVVTERSYDPWIIVLTGCINILLVQHEHTSSSDSRNVEELCPHTVIQGQLVFFKSDLRGAGNGNDQRAGLKAPV